MPVEASAWRHELEERRAELLYRRCAADPATFMREVVWVQSQREEAAGFGRERFDLFDYQEDDLATITSNRFVIVLKARQLGLSTLVAGYALWLALFRPGTVILWVSNNQKNADKAVGMLDVAWQFLPAWFKERAPKKVGDAVSEKTWVHPDGMKSSIKAMPGTKTGGASETATLVILDEFALVDPAVQNDLYRSASPTTDAGGGLIIVSTARGRHNRFAKMYQQARRGTSRFKAVFHPWMRSRFVNPKAHLVTSCKDCSGRGYTTDAEGTIVYCPSCVDTRIYESKRADFPDEPWLHRAEYPATEEEAFRESGRPRFAWVPPVDAVEEFEFRGRLEADLATGEYEFVPDPDGELRMTGEGLTPEHWRHHVVSVDPATGIGADYTAITAGYLDAEGNPVRTAFWHANTIEAVEATQCAMALGRWLHGPQGPAQIVVEKQGGYGDTSINELVRASYPNIYRHRYTDRRRRTKQDTYGLPMQWKRRPLIIDKLAQFVVPLEAGSDEAKLGGIDPLLLSELESFVHTDNGRVQADTGCHDDLVMSTAIWVWVLTQDTPTATEPPSREGPVSDGQAFDLSYLMDEAEQIRLEKQRQMSRRIRRAQSARRRTMTLGGRRR